MNDLHITPLAAIHWPEVLDLLRSNGLPEAGLADHRESIRVATDTSGLLGCVALERHGHCALLRSLAVQPSHRGTGLGRRLTRVALNLAATEGIPDVYLLTETAEGFFGGLGFEVVDRAAVPREIRDTVEFSEACPTTATVMHLSVDGTGTTRI